jgi:hypothetical protein
MPQEPELIYSDLQTTYTKDDQSVEILIYKLPDTDWTLEVVDSYGNSTVYEDSFATDEAALAEALQAIQEEGIRVFIGLPSAAANDE